ncbi:hypothetical protein EXU48_00775 [Occultella glacieicola]|uniref:DUF11 domain-containing protein n=1 Tax=Occultella glacieicola TaxID=2518684 RepID=A0ABY2E8D3_9MICO|nr:DUF11 domain-containing protein [Occultella glacieicola]TDE98771.1 hypothetical protein EXU48_00775 [Occultella glacieicola]
MARMLAVTAALGLLAPGAVAAVPMPPVTAELPAPDAASTRVAFTERGAGLGQAAWSVLTPGQLVGPDVELLEGREQDYELSVTHVQSPPEAVSSFISTRDSDVGDVYVQGAEGPAVRITCDEARVSHPVVSPDGLSVAYSTSVDDGPWRIVVADIDDPPCTGGTAPAISEGDWDDLWPAWLPGFGSETLVFSSTRHDPLGDIYMIDRGKDLLYRITEDPGADTQPAVGEVGNTVALAFTTTRFRADGSLAVVDLFATSPEELEEAGEIVSPFSGTIDQSSEPTWGVNANEGVDATLLYTGTRYDPYGDIFSIDVTEEVESEFGTLAFSSAGQVAEVFSRTDREPRAAPYSESHPAWTVTPGDEQEVGEDTRVITATFGAAQSDIGVVGADGAGRERLPASTVDVDDGGPAYSPDGAWVVFSSTVTAEDGREGARLMLAAADGSVVTPLNYAWDPGVPPGSEGEGSPPAIDIHPAWSPDGTRIAFERIYQGESDGQEFRTTEVLIADFVPEPAGGDVPVAATLSVPGYGNPDWSPDGRYLVTAGSLELAAYSDVAIVDLQDPDPETALTGLQYVPQGCGSDGCLPVGVNGRAPAWSPDGRTLAIANVSVLGLSSLGTRAISPDGETTPIALFTVDPDDPTAPSLEATPLVGFDDQGLPTPSRAELSNATDPAWSPDGSEIYLAGQPAGLADDWGIYAIRPDGTGLREVAQGPGPEIAPDVQPDVDLSLAMTASPNVVPVGGASTLTLTVRNEGLQSVGTYRVLLEAPAELQFGEPPAGCTVDDLVLTCVPTEPIAPLGVSILEIAVIGRVPGTTAEVSAVVLPGGPDRDADNNTVSTTITVTGTSIGTQEADLDLNLAVTPPTGWVGGQPMIARITVTNNGPEAITSATVTTGFPATVVPTALAITSTAPEDLGPPVDLTDPVTVACLTAAGACPIGPLLAGDSVVLEASLLPVGPAGTGEVTATVALDPAAARVDVDPGNDAATAVVTVLQPEIRLLPSVARPGDVVLAYGEDFPPNQAVTLIWTRGITVDPGPYTVTPEGRLVVPIVLVSRDLLGDREIASTSPAGAFGEVRGPLLVVATSVQAPNFLFRG